MDVLLNENQKMRDALKSIKSANANPSYDQRIDNLLKNLNCLYLTDFSILDPYDLENNVKDVARELCEDNDAFDSEEVEIEVPSDIKAMIENVEYNWIPIVMVSGKSLQTTNFAFNLESSEIQSIDALTKQIQSFPFQVTYCSYKGETGLSTEYGLYYEKEPTYKTESVYSTLDLKDSLDKYISKTPNFLLVREEKEEELELWKVK